MNGIVSFELCPLIVSQNSAKLDYLVSSIIHTHLRRIVFWLSISLFAIGGSLISMGLPYAASHYGCGMWCEGISVNYGSNPPIERILAELDVFEHFTTYGIVTFIIGMIVYFAYKIELKEVPRT